MAKRVRTRATKRAVKKTAKRTVPRRQAAPPNFLGVIRGAIVHKAARPILGRLSGEDLDVLARHTSAGTLMSALTPLADTTTKDDAVSAMPRDVGNVIAKLPESDVTTLRYHLKRLDRDKYDALVCPC
jgi:hypothetical protein